MMRIDGGPAFPHSFKTLAAPLNAEPGRLYPAEEVTVTFAGMSTRDYFAAHAPAMPDWWTWTNPEARPVHPNGKAELSREHYEQWQGLGDWIEREEAPPEVIAFAERFAAASADIQAWNLRNEMGKLAAWRWFYADSMVQGCVR